jgi:D-glycero-D-manno-heptose 1,7-bisphosphate phosphatase
MPGSVLARLCNCYHSGVSNSVPNAFPGAIHTVFLDRDGVVNEKLPEGRYVAGWDSFRILPGVLEAIRLLNQSGVRVIVVSNQRGIALGLYTSADVQAIHASLQSLLHAQGAHIDAFYFCPHDKGECDCRKPLTGMFEQAVAEFPGITAAASMMIGDSFSDIEFGRRLGMTTVFLESDSGQQKPGVEAARELADMRFPSLYTAVTDLLAKLADKRASSGTMCLGFPSNPN